jgi:hypothetical protein
LKCPTCFDASAASLGLGVERQASLAEEEAILEPYDEVRWRVTRSELEPAEGGDQVRVRFERPERFGLFRLAALDAASDELLWIGSLEVRSEDQTVLLVAARRRAAFERFIAGVEERHAEHERTRPGLLVVDGACSSHRAPAPMLDWGEVLLPASQRDELRRTVREFFAARELYRRHRLAFRRGILLAGPPGNGKTTIVRALGSEAGVPVVVLMGVGEGSAGRSLHRAFERARILAPCILCFEDLDAHLDEPPLLALFLNLLDGLEALEGVLVVATTNRPEKIDPAIARRPSRFDRVFVIGAPDAALRRQYFEAAFGPAIAASTAARLAARTEGYSVAFLKEVVVEARLLAMRRGDETPSEADLDAGLETTAGHLKLAARGLEERGDVGFRGRA